MLACNDGNRCAPALGPISETADQGESPLAQPGILQEIEMAVEGVPCLTTPMPFDPIARTGDARVRGPDADVPAVAARDDPSAGDAATRGPAGATVELRWRHPSRWRSLRDVTVRFVGRRGVLATLRFDQNANRLTLGRPLAGRPVAPAG